MLQLLIGFCDLGVALKREDRLTLGAGFKWNKLLEKTYVIREGLIFSPEDAVIILIKHYEIKIKKEHGCNIRSIKLHLEKVNFIPI